MKWTEFNFKIDCKDVECASSIITMHIPYGMYIEDYSDMEEVAPKMRIVDYYSDELKNADREHAIIHIYLNETDNPSECVYKIEELLRANKIDFEKSSCDIDMEKVLSSWKKHYKPTKISKSLVVVPSWINYNPASDEIILKMDPENAFGSGTHESTRLTATLIEKYIKEDASVLDMGTGSGILAISALLLNAKEAVGVDIDKAAVITAEKNAVINGVSDRCRFVAGNLCDEISDKYDIISANIVADVIISFLPYIDKFMKEDSMLAISGIIDSRESDVISEIQKNNFEIIDRLTENGWVALALKKNIS